MSTKVDRPFCLSCLMRFIASFVDDIHSGAMTFDDLMKLITELLLRLIELFRHSVLCTIRNDPQSFRPNGFDWRSHTRRSAFIDDHHPSTCTESESLASYFRAYVSHFSAWTECIRECATGKLFKWSSRYCGTWWHASSVDFRITSETATNSRRLSPGDWFLNIWIWSRPLIQKWWSINFIKVDFSTHNQHRDKVTFHWRRSLCFVMGTERSRKWSHVGV